MAADFLKSQQALHEQAVRQQASQPTPSLTVGNQPLPEVLTAHFAACGFPRHLSDVPVALSQPVAVVGAGCEADLCRFAIKI